MRNAKLEVPPWKIHFASHKLLGSTQRLVCTILQPVIRCASEKINWSGLKPQKSLNLKKATEHICMSYVKILLNKHTIANLYSAAS